ncbi:MULTISPECIES: hypothetical protein [unclassified Vibrio]|uniref:hypothetical protein n=1 Tax=unclassified Vibrio TaxID=2614977 RepID=UPI001EF06CC5|nr:MULTISPECIES: hypothetical protein [unclassified Vibrio]
MHKLQNGSQVTERPVRKPRVGTRGYFSESNDQGAPSHPGQDWFNDCIDEFANALAQADIPYDPQRLDHLARAIAEAKANWGADIVSQTEAQAGTAATARKWTAQRVRQAIVAWWDSIPKGTAFNKNFGSTAGTVCPGNDSRLSDAREWLANTVSQAEAEGGESNTPRKWTAQRVRQAILGWSSSVSPIRNKPIQVINTGSANDFFYEGVYSLSFTVDDKPEGAGGVLEVKESELGRGIRTFSQPTIGGELDLRVFSQSFNALGFTEWFEHITTKNEQQLGFAQDWNDVTNQRGGNQIFTNNKSKPIFVSIAMNILAGPINENHQIRKNSNSPWITVGQASSAAVTSCAYVVPPGWQYRSISSSIKSWSELY